MEFKVKRTQAGVELSGSLPHEISNSESVEIFPLRDGAYLLAVKGAIGMARLRAERGNPQGGQALSEPERALLKKLLGIRFEKRTPPEVDRQLSSREREILRALVEKRAVSVFRSGKYEQGVYNISDAVYGQARGAGAHGREGAQSPLGRGFLVLESEGEARQLSNSMADAIKSGEVSGLRSFDRKYYFIRKGFAEQWKPRLQALLEKGEMTAEELARESGLDAEGCRAVLLHLCEGGELLEKSRGRFALA